MTILKADPSRKRKAFIINAAVLIGALVFVQWGLPWFGEWIKSKDTQDAFQIMVGILAGIFLGVFTLGVSGVRKGRQIIRAGQFPLPGAKVIRDTEVLDGAGAKAKGRQILLMGILLCVLGVIGITYFPYNFIRLFEASKKARKVRVAPTLRSAALDANQAHRHRPPEEAGRAGHGPSRYAEILMKRSLM